MELQNILRLVQDAILSNDVTLIFSGIIGAVFLLALFCLMSNKGNRLALCHDAPTIMTSVGVLGTFVGIFLGLMDFNVNKIDQSVPALLAGLKVAFVTSILGMAASVVFKLLQGLISRGTETGEVGAEEIHSVLQEIRDDGKEAFTQVRQAISGDGDGSVVTYIRPVQTERDEVRDIAVTFQEEEEALFEALWTEFKSDLPKWGAELDRETLSIRFTAPEVLFDTAQVTIKDRFKVILENFFPRYVSVLWKFRKSISEVRIEGHTSSEWGGAKGLEEAYFHNMRLSQGRTRRVLAFGLSLSGASEYKKWLIRKVTANGLSSSQVVVVDGRENKELSRRVEFRVRTNAKQQIFRILEAAK
jgi:outer membrane protein OmpA-like peptidoglycan-associated protein